jgi:hypothetical protein
MEKLLKEAISRPLTHHIHDRSLSWLGLGFSIKSGFMGLNLPF